MTDKFIIALLETLGMVGFSGLMALVLGLPLGVSLYMTEHERPWANVVLHQALGLIINITRSLPFIILMIMLIPLSRMILGKSIGWEAACVPLSIAAIAFYARLSQAALNQLPSGLLQAGHSMGASSWNLIRHIIIPESIPGLIEGWTNTLIALIGYSAMAGVVGGGGLGALAFHYGYMRFETNVMIITSLILLALVQLLQFIGDKTANAWYKI